MAYSHAYVSKLIFRGKEVQAVDEQRWFEEIYRQYADFLFRIGRRLLSAEKGEDFLLDAIQEVFITAWNKRETLMQHPNIGGWLVEALKFRLRNAREKITRRSLRHAYSLDEENAFVPADPKISLEDEMILGDRIDAIREVLGEENTELFIAYVLKGYSVRDLAKQTGLSVDGVWMRISRIKKRLARHPEIFYIFLVWATEIGRLNT